MTAKLSGLPRALRAIIWFFIVYAIVSLAFFVLHLCLLKFNNPGLIYWLTLIGSPIAFMVGASLVWGRRDLDITLTDGIITFAVCFAALRGLISLAPDFASAYYFNVCGFFSTEGMYYIMNNAAAHEPVRWWFDASYVLLFVLIMLVPHDFGKSRRAAKAAAKKA